MNRPKVKPKMKESDFQKEIIKFITTNGGYVVNHFANKFTKVGVPDLLVSIDGYFHGIELKTDIGIETELQAHHMDNINKSGGYGYVLRPTVHKKLHYTHEFDYWQLTVDEWLEDYWKGVN